MKNRLIVLTLIVGFHASTASAQLVLNIDTATQTFWISGSETGTPGADIGGGAFNWSNGGTSSGTNQFEDVLNTVTSSNSAINYGPQMQGNDTGTKILFAVGVDSIASTSIAGTSTAVDYSGWNGNMISNFEALIGSSLTSSKGTLNDISVVAGSAVPEPSTYAAILGSLTLAGTVLARRRRRRKTLTA